MEPGKLLMVLAVGLLFACEKQSQPNPDAWVAKWGSASVSQAELDWGLQQAGKLDRTQRDTAKAQILQTLINQKLIASAAKRNGLARNPAVHLEEESARRQVLVRAFAESLGTGIAKPTSQMVADYYQQYPQLFSRRRVYQLQEIHVQANAAQSGAIREQLARSASLTELFDWLNAQNMHGTIMNGLKPAEQLPDTVRNELAKMSVGQVALLPAKDGVSLLQVQRIEDQPLTLAQAAPIIDKLLVAKQQKEMLDSELKKLRDAVKIEYAPGLPQAAKQ